MYTSFAKASKDTLARAVRFMQCEQSQHAITVEIILNFYHFSAIS